jgi:hypothetical protein
MGQAWMAVNGTRSMNLVACARWACIPFSVLGALGCYVFARDLANRARGLAAAGFWCTSPLILGHGQLVVAEVPTSALAIWSVYAFWKWFHSPAWDLSIVAGVLLGLACLCKTSMLLLFAVMGTLGACRIVSTAPRSLKQSLQLCGTLSLALLVINGGFGFKGTGKPLGDYVFVSEAFGGGPTAARTAGNRFAGTWCGRLPVPLPEDYLRGIDLQRADFEHKSLAYFRGEFRRGGWWSYYVYGLALKTPVAGLLVLVVACGVYCAGWSSGRWCDHLILLAPPISLLVLVSSQSNMNQHLRYAIPVLPFLFVWCASPVSSRAPWFGRLLLLGVVASGASSAAVYPHLYSYANELGGGPRRGHEHLLGTSQDWNLDLLYLNAWLDDHPEVKRIAVALGGPAPFHVIDERMDALPFAMEEPDSWPPGWYALCLTRLYGDPVSIAHWPRSEQFRSFRARAPEGRAGYSLLIFRHTGRPSIGASQAFFKSEETAGRSKFNCPIELALANDVRARLGLDRVTDQETHP